MGLNTLFAMEITVAGAALFAWGALREHGRAKQPGFRLIAASVALYVFQLVLVHYLSIAFLHSLDAPAESVIQTGDVLSLVISAPIAALCVFCLYRGFGMLIRAGYWSAGEDSPRCPNPRCGRPVGLDETTCRACGQAYTTERLLFASPDRDAKLRGGAA